MFKNQRYITRGVEAAIPQRFQNLIWACIDHLPDPRDYFQVFQFKPIGVLQCITHSSEQPEYKMEYLISADEPITRKVYVIDSGDYTTMLLAEEY